MLMPNTCCHRDARRRRAGVCAKQLYVFNVLVAFSTILSMILRPQITRSFRLFSLFLLLHTLSPVSADDAAFDCLLTIDSFKYNLTSLAGEHVISRTRETPPSSMVDSVTFNLCADLKLQDGVAERDQVRHNSHSILVIH